jgi:hypothetical protein
MDVFAFQAANLSVHPTGVPLCFTLAGDFWVREHKKYDV